MSIKINKILAISDDKEDAVIDFKLESHLVYGPTDTGKSYIIEIFNYLLGSDKAPKDIGFSEGYSHFILQLLHLNEKYSIIRDIRSHETEIVSGYVQQIADYENLEISLSDFLISLCTNEEYKILTKTGTLGALTPNDLRRISIFHEIETLSNIALIGNDKLFKVRNRASLSLVISGNDDKNIILAPKTNDIYKAKGQVEWLVLKIEELEAFLDDKIERSKIDNRLIEIDGDLQSLDLKLVNNSEMISKTKNDIVILQRKFDSKYAEFIASTETLQKFNTIKSKYNNDLLRLESIGLASRIIPEYETVKCPICLSEYIEQDDSESFSETLIAVEHEKSKISNLKKELEVAINELALEIENQQNVLKEISQSISLKEKKYNNFLNTISNIPKQKIQELSNEKSDMKLLLEKYSNLDVYKKDLEISKSKSKRKKQEVERNISSSSTKICIRVKELLEEWGLNDISIVSFDEESVDLNINNRPRISYGKGKRGIFLTAFIYSIMEHSINNGYPHYGFIIVDSPLVTYRDPKNGSNDTNETVSMTVKDNFYKWLESGKYSGQIIILENEDPFTDMNFNITEFVGNGGAVGRIGFYPI